MTGKAFWTHTGLLDDRNSFGTGTTTNVKNGAQAVRIRAIYVTDYSDPVTRTFSVENQKAAGKGFIPMIDWWMALALLAMVGAKSVMRRN